MAPKADGGRKISANFAVFIITFLVFTTLVVFAVLLFLSYENMYNNLVIKVINGTDTVGHNLASDITSLTSMQPGEFRYTMDNDGSENFKNSRIVDRFVNSEIYRESGSIYFVDKDGRILSRNSREFEAEDSLAVKEGTGRNSYLADEDVLSLIRQAEKDGKAGSSSQKPRSVTSTYCTKVSGIPYFILVKNYETTMDTFTEYINVIFVPAMIAMVISIILYAVFVYLSLMPIKEISRAIASVAEGDFSVRVSRRFSVPEDYSSFAVSSEFTEMGMTVNNMIESLENAERDREMFISSIAHDIRTPLTSINGFVTAMTDGTIPPEKHDHYLMLIKQQSDRIRTLVTQMTEASSLSHVDPKMMEDFNISDMINDIIDNLEAQLSNKDITIIKSLDPGPGITAYGDAQQLCRVIINIITNAIKFTPQGGSIKVSTTSEPRNRRIMIQVEDSGAGVEESKRKRIFESFYKADPSRKVEGFGLGLYICKQILAAHGQTISCEDGTELGGARFVFYFPFPPEKQG